MRENTIKAEWTRNGKTAKARAEYDEVSGLWNVQVMDSVAVTDERVTSDVWADIADMLYLATEESKR